MKSIEYIDNGHPVCLLFLHSSMSSKRQWRHYLPVLNTQYNAMLIDFLGYGEALHEDSLSDYQLLTEVSRIVSALEQHKVSRLTVIGHSFGGAVALRLADHLQYQSWLSLEQVLVFEPVAFHLLSTDSTGHQQIHGLIDSLRLLPPKGVAQQFTDYWNHSGFFSGLPATVQQTMVAQASKVLLDFDALTMDTKTLDDYRKLTMPVTVLRGKHSPQVARDLCQQIVNSLDNSRLVEVDGGHMSPMTQAKMLAEIIAKLLV